MMARAASSRKPSAPKGKRGTRNVQWIEEHCVVPEGKHVGQPMRLRPWQRRILRELYDTPTRRGLLSMGRKNGKTSLVACLVLLHLVGPEARRNSQIYSAAQSRDQAAIVFGLAAKMVRLSATLAPFVGVKDTAKTLVCAELGTVYRALSADAATAHGYSPVLVIHDELGQVRGPRSELYEALETAMGAHEAPLSLVISTQAPTDADLLSILLDDAQAANDPTTKVWLFTAPLDSDPWAPSTWKLANPALGDFRSLPDVRDQAERAKRMPSQEASFRNLVLNQRVESSAPFVPQAVWQACGQVPPPLEEWGGRRIVAGLDLASTSDLAALVLVGADARGESLWVCPYLWLPAEGLMEKAHQDRVPYDVWARDGLVRTTPGRAIDERAIARLLGEVSAMVTIEAVAYDRWGVKRLEPHLTEAGVRVPMVEWGQGFRDMAPSIQALEAALLAGRLCHGNHPVLTWMVRNVRVVADDAGNRKFSKRRSTARIDGIQALAMACGALQAAPPAVAPSTPRVMVWGGDA